MLALVTSSALAQEENPYGGGTRLHGAPPVEVRGYGLRPASEVRTILASFSDCMVARHYQGVRLALLQPQFKKSDKSIRLVIDDRCLQNAEMITANDLLRGALFRALYRRDFGKLTSRMHLSVIDFSEGERPPYPDIMLHKLILLDFGDCLAHRDAALSRTLVLASPDGQEEAQAIAAFVPAFSSCLGNNATLHINKVTLSAVMSEVLYRETVAAMPAPGIRP